MSTAVHGPSKSPRIAAANRKTRAIYLRISNETHAKLDAKARKTGKSITRVIRELLEKRVLEELA